MPKIAYKMVSKHIAKIATLLLILFCSLSYAQQADNPLFDMTEILNEESLEINVIQDWHLVRGNINTRQKYITIKVGEFWQGKEYRVPVRLIVPADKKAKGFHLTGGHQLKQIRKDAQLRGVDVELLKGGVGLVQTVVQSLSSWGEKKLWLDIHKKFYKTLNPKHSIQYWGWPAGLMRAVTAAYAEKKHFEIGNIAATGSSKNGASPSVALIHDIRITALHASVSPISESPLRLCNEDAWKVLNKFNTQHTSASPKTRKTQKHRFLGGTFGPLYNDFAINAGNTWADLKALAKKVEHQIFISKNLEQLNKREVDFMFHPGTHDYVAFDMPYVGKNYPQIPVFLRVNSGHSKKGKYRYEPDEKNKEAFLLDHFFNAGSLLSPPVVNTTRKANKLQVRVIFPQGSKAESGRIYWM